MGYDHSCSDCSTRVYSAPFDFYILHSVIMTYKLPVVVEGHSCMDFKQTPRRPSQRQYILPTLTTKWRYHHITASLVGALQHDKSTTMIQDIKTHDLETRPPFGFGWPMQHVVEGHRLLHASLRPVHYLFLIRSRTIPERASPNVVSHAH